MKTWILSGAGVLSVAVIAACSSSSSSNGGGDGGSSSSGSGGGSSSSGASSSSGGSSSSGSGSSSSSGGSGSSSGGSSSSGSGGSSSSSSGGLGDGGMGTETALAKNLGNVTSLTLMGSSLYWADTTNNAILSVPTAGGTPTTLVSNPGLGTVDGALATDGTHLFFGLDSGGTTSIVSSDGMGQNQVTLSSGFSIVAPMFYAGGNLVAEGSVNLGANTILQIPTDGSLADGGGTPTALTTPSQPTFSLVFADATSVYWNAFANANSGEVDFLTFANPSVVSAIFMETSNSASAATGMTTSGGATYFTADVQTSGTYTGTLYKSTGAGMATTVGTLAGMQPVALVADGAGAFVLAGPNSSSTAIDKIDLSSGATAHWDTSVATSQLQGQALLDAQHLYFVAGAGASYGIYSVTR